MRLDNYNNSFVNNDAKFAPLHLTEDIISVILTI